MIELSIEEACKKLHWHDSSAYYLKFDESKQELSLELELCDCCINDDDDNEILFNGQTGTLIFHGLSSFSLEPEQVSEKIGFEFLSSECLCEDGQEGLLLWGIAWLNIPTFERDYFTLRFLADSASWHPKNQ